MRPARVARGSVTYGSPRLRESDIAEAIRLTVLAAGYFWESTQEHRRRVMCPNQQCGQWFTPAGGSGVTKGIGDALLGRTGWGALKLNVEFKKPGGRPTEEQQKSIDRGTLILIDPKGDYKRQALEEILKVERRFFGSADGHADAVARLLDTLGRL